MEDVTKDLTSTGNSFTQHMFKFDNDTKSELMNVGQHACFINSSCAFSSFC